MASITVVCDECGETVDGLIDCATTPDGEAFIMTGGFYLYDFGVSCDDCVAGENGPSDTGTEQEGNNAK